MYIVWRDITNKNAGYFLVQDLIGMGWIPGPR